MNTEGSLLESLFRYLGILLKYRRLVFMMTAVGALGVGAFCAASILLPPKRSPLPNEYTASAIILVHQGVENDLSTSIRTALGIGGGPTDAGPGFDRSAFLLMVLQSRTLLDTISDEFGIAQRYGITDRIKSQSRTMLLKRLRFENTRATGAITISYRDVDPVFARDLANRMVAILSEWYSQNVGSSNQRQKMLLDEKIGEVQMDITRLEGRLNELQNRYGVLTAQDLWTSQASTLVALRSQLILKEIDIRNYASVSSADDPKRRQLEAERKNILDLISRLQEGSTETLDSSTSAKTLPDVQAEFNNLTVELEVQRKIYNTLSHQSEVMKLTSDSDPPFRVMELAEVPDAKSGPRRMLIIVEVIVGAFGASIALALFLNGISRVRAVQHKHSFRRKS